MLLPNTVFVLGAAVSAELGFPLGSELKGLIQAIFGSSDPADEIRFVLAQKGQGIWKGVRLLCAGLPIAASIDNLIEFHRDNADVVAAGKIGIAATILDQERKCPLRIDHRRGRSQHQIPHDNTLGDIFRLIIQRASEETLEEAFSRVTFINFNYDRCVEQFMWRALIDHMGLDPRRATEVAARMVVQHPYGDLGPLHGQNAVIFGQELSSAPLDAMAMGIRTFSEGVDSNAGHQIKSSIAAAERIIFLGCAHHPQNMELLNPQRRIKAREVYGTLYAPPPIDPVGHAAPSMTDFLEPAIKSFVRNLLLWKGADSLTGIGPLRESGCRIEALTSRQLVARYGSAWTDYHS